MAQWNDACLICGDRFFSQNDMDLHLRNKHFDNAIGRESTVEAGQAISPSRCQCPFCSFEAELVDIVNEHICECHTAEMKTPKKDSECEKTSADQVEENIIFCPMCEVGEFGFMESLQVHVEGHFMDEQCEVNDETTENEDELLAIRLRKKQEFEKYKESKAVAENLHLEDLQDKYGMTSNSKNFQYSSATLRSLHNDVGKSISPYEFYSQQIAILEKLEEGIDDGLSMSEKPFHQLTSYLQQTLNKDQKAYLCSHLDFIGRGAGDAGWGCGYRNIQMLISSMTKHPAFCDVAQKEFKGSIPSIPKIQEFIEKAWKEGYDIEGSLQLQSKLLKTRKWIGATEAFTFFACLKLHCQIVDFNATTMQPYHGLLLKWILAYFEVSQESSHSNSVVIETKKLPLYLQHDGHSRTIVGVITSMVSGGMKIRKLLIFDPGIQPSALWKRDKQKKYTESRCSQSDFLAEKLLKPVSDLRKKQYQLVAVVGHASEDRVLQQKDINAVCEKPK